MLHCQLHYRVDYIVTVWFEGGDSLCTRHASLLHHQLDVFVVYTTSVYVFVFDIVFNNLNFELFSGCLENLFGRKKLGQKTCGPENVPAWLGFQDKILL